MKTSFKYPKISRRLRRRHLTNIAIDGRYKHGYILTTVYLTRHGRKIPMPDEYSAFIPSQNETIDTLYLVQRVRKTSMINLQRA